MVGGVASTTTSNVHRCVDAFIWIVPVGTIVHTTVWYQFLWAPSLERGGSTRALSSLCIHDGWATRWLSGVRLGSFVKSRPNGLQSQSQFKPGEIQLQRILKQTGTSSYQAAAAAAAARAPRLFDALWICGVGRVWGPVKFP